MSNLSGFLFTILDEKNQMLNYGTVLEQEIPGTYLVQFENPPVSCRVVHVNEIMTFNLFRTNEQRNDFVATVCNPSTPTTPKKKKKKKAPPKKVSDPQPK